MLVGAGVLIPIILIYTGWAYWVFRGKVADGAGPSVSGVVRLAIEASIERAGRPVAGAAPAAPETRKAVHV